LKERGEKEVKGDFGNMGKDRKEKEHYKEYSS
jgi:hypothetical protein